MPKASIAGLQVDTFSKSQLLEVLAGHLAGRQKTFVVTPYGEFLYAALRDPKTMALLNSADIAIPDGVSILWAERFLSLPFSARSYYGKVFQALWQIIYTGAAILLNPKSIYKTFPEKITGADLVWDIAELAAKNNYSVYLLGGFGETTKKTAEILRKKYPGLNIVGTSNKSPGDEAEILPDLAAKQPDILLVAFGPLRQEKWISEHYGQIPAKLIIGLGGTFDYIAGRKKAPPRFVRRAGLEWLYRLITQPRRLVRIKNATWDLVLALWRYKVFQSMPWRPNAVFVVLNDEGKVLLMRRSPTDWSLRDIGERIYLGKYDNYWQLPQGGIDANETVMDCAKRELFEEIGLRTLSPIGTAKKTHAYLYNNAFRPLLRNAFHVRGQLQQVAYLNFSGSSEEIKLTPEEVAEVRWIEPAELVQSVHEQRQPVTRLASEGLADLQNLEKPA